MYLVVSQSTRKTIIQFLNRGDAVHWMAMNDPLGELFMIVNSLRTRKAP